MSSSSPAGVRPVRKGEAGWSAGARVQEGFKSRGHRLPGEERETDVVVLGAGVTGALVTDALASAGRRVAVVDPREAGAGSTAVSTALLLYDLDRPLVELETILGWARAREAYRCSAGALVQLEQTARRVGVPLRPRTGLYVAGSRLGPAGLRTEWRLRRRAGLPVDFVGAGELRGTFGVARDAALATGLAFDVDPVALTAALLGAATATGRVRMIRDRSERLEPGRSGVRVILGGGALRAKAVVHATGYALPEAVPRRGIEWVQTFALAGPSGERAGRWPRNAVLWEAAEPYLYARQGVRGEVIAGGCDRPASGGRPEEREVAARTDHLARAVEALIPGAMLRPTERRWSALFAQTFDSLPLIGPIGGSPGEFAAFGYSGNGITFSSLAAGVLARQIAGVFEAGDELFRVGRFG